MTTLDSMEKPRQRFQFRLSTLIFAIFCGSVFLALRAVVMNSDALHKTIYRALWLRTLLAALCGAYSALMARRDCKRTLGIVLSGIVAGAAAASLTVIVLAIEIASAVGGEYPDYFQWSRDWLEIANVILLEGVIIGAIVGGSVASFWLIRRPTLRYSFLLSVVAVGCLLWYRVGTDLVRVRQEGKALEKFANGQGFYFDLAPDADLFLVPPHAVVEVLQTRLAEYVFQTVVTVKILNEVTVQSEVTDWTQIQVLKNLRTLELSKTGVSDSDLVYLGTLKKLEYLSLDESAITDAGLLHLHGLQNLKVLTLTNGKTTTEGELQLKKVLPDCSIVH